MSMTSISLASTRTDRTVRLADYIELTKPKIVTLMLITVGVAAFVANWGPPSGWLLIHTLLGTMLVAASASAINQLLERETDARMERTADRPLPAGRLSTREVIWFSVLTLAVGLPWLAWYTNWTTAALGLLTWALYAWVYTPLKTRTPLNTTVGAVAGALPVLMGWSSTGAALDLRAWSMFMIVFLWQFPHFMAIAWIYRRQYAAAGLKMLSVVDQSGYRSGAQAVVSALLLIPVSLVPCLLIPESLAPSVSRAGAEIYFVWAVLLGVAQWGTAIWFFLDRKERSARLLLWASLIYLPVIMGLLLLGPLA